MTAVPIAGAPARESRYWRILLLAVALVTFGIVAPRAEWMHAAGVGVQATVLVIAASACRLPAPAPRIACIASGLAVAVALVATVTGGLSEGAAVTIAAVLVALTTLTVVASLAQSVRSVGVTRDVVLGAIAVYLLIGGFFTFLMTAVAALDGGAFFRDGVDAAPGDYLYFSFTVLTTTGFGDLAAATPAGRSVAVLEMLIGQMYLVTVISVLVTEFARRLR